MDNKENNEKQKKLLYAVLSINFFFFVLEMVFGIVSRSMGLIADSLDMFADTVVYGLALWAVGSHLSRKASRNDKWIFSVVPGLLVFLKWYGGLFLLRNALNILR